MDKKSETERQLDQQAPGKTVAGPGLETTSSILGYYMALFRNDQ